MNETHEAVKATAPAGAVDALNRAIASYFDGIYEGDTEKLAAVMHPRVRLFCPTDGNLLELDLPAYLKLVGDRPAPAERGDPRHDRIVTLGLSSATTAHARVQDAYLPRLFTDDLTFVMLDGEWRIVAKVWHYSIAE